VCITPTSFNNITTVIGMYNSQCLCALGGCWFALFTFDRFWWLYRSGHRQWKLLEKIDE
jgi:hypothetical protein